MLLVDCWNCKTVLQYPTGATSIRCVVCHVVTRVVNPRSSRPHHTRPRQLLSTTPHHSAPTPPQLYKPVGAPGGGRKKAVICGIAYRNTPDPLDGCINDAKCMKYLLIHQFKFPENDILMLTDDEDPYRIPTKKNIRIAMDWLVAGCQAGDSLVFHFSGHGDQEDESDSDEEDGFNEGLRPLDYETTDNILDDEINERIVRPLPHGAKLTAIIDACHSGTMLDLPFLCKMYRSRQRFDWKDHRPRSGRWKGTSGGEAISISGCADDQTSADKSPLSRVSTGAMTFAFIQAIAKGYASTYGSLINAMSAAIRDPDNSDLGVGADTTLVKMLRKRGNNATDDDFKQDPQLCATDPFDVYARPFSL